MIRPVRSRLRAPLAVAALAVMVPAGAVDLAHGSQDVVSWKVDAGTTAALAEDHRVPLVHLRIEFPAGNWSPWLRRTRAGEALEVQMYDTSASLRSRADRLAVDILPAVEDLTSSLTLECRKDDLGEALRLLKDVLANRDFDRRELVRRKQQNGIAWAASLKDPDFVLRQAVVRLLFAEDDPRRWAYEKPPAPITDGQSLAAARDLLIRLPGRSIGWGGDLTRAEAERFTTGLLPPADAPSPADLEARLAPIRNHAAGGADTIVRMPRLTQVYFADTGTMPGIRDPDYPALMIADHVIGGHFYSRLYEALRHEGGDTYGAATRRAAEIEPGSYYLWTFTKTSNSGAVEQKLEAVLRQFFEKGITEGERAAAAGFLLGRRAFGKQSPGQIVDRFLWDVRRGLPPGYRDDLAERAAAAPLVEINAFIRRFYDPARFHMIKVEPR